MVTPDRKVRKLMTEYEKTGSVSKAALRADMDRKTAGKYLKAGKLPSQMPIERTWRTREDPFSEHWEECRVMLEDCPELEAKTVFEYLCETYSGQYQEGQLRTFQRRVREWRALSGPEQDVHVIVRGKASAEVEFGNFLGRPLRSKGFASRELAVSWAVLARLPTAQSLGRAA